MYLKVVTLSLLALSASVMAEEKTDSAKVDKKTPVAPKVEDTKKDINNEGVLSEFFKKTVGSILQEGNYDGAITKIKELLGNPELSKKNKQNIYLEQLHGIYMEKGDIDAAIKALKEGIALDPESELAKAMAPQLEELEKNKDMIKKRIAMVQKQQEAAKKQEEDQASAEKEELEGKAKEGDKKE